MQFELIKAMRDINKQIKSLDKEFDAIAISELRRQRFFIISVYKYFFYRDFDLNGVALAVKSKPENFRITEDSHANV